jgi:hypothetical protein
MKTLRIIVFTNLFIVSLLSGLLALDSNGLFSNKKWNENHHSHWDRAGEFLVDTGFSLVPAPYGQTDPAIATDGSGFLVVWADQRSASDYDIYGTRIDSLGQILDPSGIEICFAIYDQERPNVAFDGNNYLVVWEDMRNNPSERDIYGARVSVDGTVLEPTGFAITTAIDDQFRPSIAFDGTNYLAVWQDRRIGGYFDDDIFGARIDPSGTVIDTNSFLVSRTPDNQRAPSVAFGDSTFFAVWQDDRIGGTDYDIYGTQIYPDGTVFDTIGIALYTENGNQSYPRIAFGANIYLIIWNELHAIRITQNGFVLDSTSIEISPNPQIQYTNHSVTFNGANFFASWVQDPANHYIYGARVDPAGYVIDTSGIAISLLSGGRPVVEFAGSIHFVAWMTNDIFGSRVHQSGTVIDTNGYVISTEQYYYEQNTPAIAFDGTNYLAVWSDFRSDSVFDIYGARIDQFGNILDHPCLSISASNNDQLNPSISFDGTNYFVIWEDFRNGNYSDIYGTRVTPLGNVLEPFGIIVSSASNNQGNPSIEFDGANYLAVWRDRRSGSNYDIYCTRINQNGNVLNPSGTAISTAVNDQNFPSVSFGDSNYLVVWQDMRASNNDIYGARVNLLGNVIDPVGIAISEAPLDQTKPIIAFDITNHLVVWEDGRNGSDSFDIYATRVDQNITILDSQNIAISNAPNNQKVPSLEFNGSDYIILWQDARLGSYDIHGATVNTSGLIIDSFIVSNQMGNQIESSIARGQGNQMLVCYSGFTELINGNVANSMRIWGDFDPAIGISEGSQHKSQRNISIRTFPNPFIERLIISSQGIGNFHKFSLQIYDVSGRAIKQFPLEREITWDGKDSNNRYCPPGIYFLKLNGKPVGKVVKVR